MERIFVSAFKVIRALYKSGIWKNYFFQSNVKMAVLGMVASGKTSWYNYLKNGEPGNPEQTHQNEIVESFRIQIPKDHYLIVSEGKDISGINDNVPPLYRPMIKENDIILFLFNSFEFYNKIVYREEVIDRIALIAEEYNKEVTSVFIIPTHKDVLLASNVSEGNFKDFLFNELRSDISAKIFAEVENVTPLFQTNNKEDLDKLKEIVFSKYKKS